MCAGEFHQKIVIQSGFRILLAGEFDAGNNIIPRRRASAFHLAADTVHHVLRLPVGLPLLVFFQILLCLLDGLLALLGFRLLLVGEARPAVGGAAVLLHLRQ